MNARTRSIICFATAALVSTSLYAADATTQPVSPQQLQDEVHDLQSEVNTLKQQEAAEAKQTPARTSETSGVELGRGPSTTPAQGFMSGYTLDRFTLQSPDGSFVLRPWL
jgi:hypothetical protein